LKGRVIDVGGGHAPDYFDFFKKDERRNDCGPRWFNDRNRLRKRCTAALDGSADTSFFAMSLSNIYGHQFLLGEVQRILSADGALIGFVPFWVGYHPESA